MRILFKINWPAFLLYGIFNFSILMQSNLCFSQEKTHKNILAILNSRDRIFETERNSELGTEWLKISFADMTDLTQQIRIQPYVIDILEISAHGSSTQFADLTRDLVKGWSENFVSETAGIIGPNTIIYLSGCNTGVPLDNSMATIFSNYTHLEVYGTQGFMCGLYSQNNEVCLRCAPETVNKCKYCGGMSPNNCGCNNEPRKCSKRVRPGQKNEVSRNVWYASTPRLADTVKIYNSNLISYNLIQTNKKLIQNINSTIKEKSIGFPQLRIAPDLTIVINESFYDVYANLTIIKNRSTQKSYSVNNSLFILLKSLLNTRENSI